MGSFASSTALSIIMLDTTFDTATTALASKVIDQVEAKVKSALSKRFDVSGWTSTTVPPQVTSICEQLACGTVYKLMSRGSKEAVARAESILESANEELKAIIEHESELCNTSGSAIPDISTGAYYVKSTTQNYQPIIDLDDQTKWEIDSDQAEDIANERE